MDFDSLISRALTDGYGVQETIDGYKFDVNEYLLNQLYAALEESIPVESIICDEDDSPIFTADEADSLFRYLQISVRMHLPRNPNWPCDFVDEFGDSLLHGEGGPDPCFHGPRTAAAHAVFIQHRDLD